jgi:hypothetical protein
MNDPILDEIRGFRDEYAKRFNYDIDAMAQDIRHLEQDVSDRLVYRRPRPVQADQKMKRRTDSKSVAVG